jgi:predicted transcriptional regulator
MPLAFLIHRIKVPFDLVSYQIKSQFYLMIRKDDLMLNGKKLQYIRRLKGLSQVYIADCIGVSERWIGKVENEGSTPSQELYEKWLLALYGKIKPAKKETVTKKKATSKQDK